MRRVPVWLLAGPGLLAALGCAHPKACDSQETHPGRLTEALPLVQRTSLESQIVQVSYHAAATPLKDPRVSYKALTACQCQRLAACSVALAQMLEGEADALGLQQSKKLCSLPGQQRLVSLHQEILRDNALELKNSAAGLALNLFFRIAEAEALSDLQQESLAVSDEALARMLQLKDRGLKANEDVLALQRQQQNLVAEGVRLQMSIDDLNTELNRLLDLDISTCTCPSRFWPVFQLHFQPGKPDCCAAVAEGLAKRPELAMLQRIYDELDPRTLKLVRSMLQSVNGLLGTDTSGCKVPLFDQLVGLVCEKSAVDDEVQTRKEQVAEYRAGRVRGISSEIIQDVRNLESRAQLVGLARERIASWQKRLDELQTKKSKGMVSFAELADARLQWIKARADLIREVFAWERELVQLHMHQGAFALCCEDHTVDNSDQGGRPAER